MKKGHVMSKEQKQKISDAHKGYKHTQEARDKMSRSRKGQPSWWKGKVRRPKTQEEKRNLSEKLKGRVLHPPFTEASKKKISESRKGQRNSPTTEFKKGFKHSEESKKRMSMERRASGLRPPVNRGIKNHMWKGGITPINEKIRKSVEYKLWRSSVIQRDSYTCIWCGILQTRENPMHVDHIKPFCDYPELRFAIDNGRTLCVPCHTTTETYAGKIISYRKNNKYD